MTVKNQTFKVIGAGNDSATIFSFSDMELPDDTSQISCVKVATDGTETTLVEEVTATGYSVSVATFPGTGSVTFPASGGTPLATGEFIAMKRILTLEQQTDLENQGGWFPETQEKQFDRGIMISLQQQEILDRSFAFPLSYTGGASAEIPVPSADLILGWNAGATALENKTPNDAQFITVPPSATDNAIVRFNGTSATSVDNSGVTIDDSDNVNIPGALTITTDLAIAEGGTGSSTAAAARTALAVAGTAVVNTFTAGNLWPKGSDTVAASPTVVLTDGKYFDITGSTGFSAFTVAAGTHFMTQFDSTPTLTHGASIILPGAANVTMAAGDVFEWFATAANVVVCVGYALASGRSIVETAIPVEATKSEMEAFSSSTAMVTPGSFNDHPGAVKAQINWINDGTVNSSYNVTSLTDTGVGNWLLTWDVDMAGTEYSMALSSVASSASSTHLGFVEASRLAASAVINNYQGGILADTGGNFSCIVVGDQ